MIGVQLQVFANYRRPNARVVLNGGLETVQTKDLLRNGRNTSANLIFLKLQLGGGFRKFYKDVCVKSFISLRSPYAIIVRIKFPIHI
jgi:hypothetical protein